MASDLTLISKTCNGALIYDGFSYEFAPRFSIGQICQVFQKSNVLCHVCNTSLYTLWLQFLRHPRHFQKVRYGSVTCFCQDFEAKCQFFLFYYAGIDFIMRKGDCFT